MSIVLSTEIFGLIPISAKSVFFVILVAFIATDLFLRFLAFGRLESIAIDVGIFSLLYEGIEVGNWYRQRASGSHPTQDQLVSYTAKFFTILLIVIVLVAVHGALRASLNDEVRRQLRAQRKAVSQGIVDSYDLAADILMRSVLLSFVGPDTPILRGGKRNWRTDVVAYVNSCRENQPAPPSEDDGNEHPLPNPLRQEDLMLSTPARLLTGFMFLLLGLVCAVLPAFPA